MAITKDLTLSSGVNLPNAYIRISMMTMKVGISAEIKAEIYKDQASRIDNKTPVATLSHLCIDNFQTFFNFTVVNQEGVNGISQGYMFLKTLPFYQDATDVMDVKE